MAMLAQVFAIPHFSLKTFQRFPPIIKLLIYPILLVVYTIWIPIRFLIWLFTPKKKRDIYEEMPPELK